MADDRSPHEFTLTPEMVRELNLWFKWLAIAGGLCVSVLTAILIVNTFIYDLTIDDRWFIALGATFVVALMKGFYHGHKYTKLVQQARTPEAIEAEHPLMRFAAEHPYATAILLIAALSLILAGVPMWLNRT